MYNLNIEIILVFIALIIGSYTDFKWREVPDYLNFLMISIGFSLGMIKSIIDYSFMPILYTLMGFIVAYLIALLMFYTGQWGGGDAKMLMGIGTILGLTFNFQDLFLSFMINTLIAGAFYGLLWGLVLAIINWKKMIIEIKKLFEDKKIKIIRIIIFCIIILILIVVWILPIKNIRVPIIVLGGLIFLTFYLYIFVKAVENVCMIKKVRPEELTEGDWIVEEVIIGKKIIASKKDLGVSKEQISKLIDLKKKRKLKFVTIKNGIPFVPSFFISFVLTLFFGNLFLYLLKFVN